MTIETLYKIKRDDGGTTITTTKPTDDIEFTDTDIRLKADEDKLLTKDGVNLYAVYDTDSSDGWYEVDRPKDLFEEESKEKTNIGE